MHEDAAHTCYLVQAVVENARKSKGYRYSLYKCAQECQGFYNIGGKDNTFYFDGDGQDLNVRVLFSSMRDARNFQNKISFFGLDHTHFGDKLKMTENVETLMLPTKPMYIYYRHYVTADNNDSPVMSLNDVLS